MQEAKSNEKEMKIPKIKAHDKVIHKTFGQGTIKKKTKNSLVIEFADGDKFFQYPDVFIGGWLEKKQN